MEGCSPEGNGRASTLGHDFQFCETHDALLQAAGGGLSFNKAWACYGGLQTDQYTVAVLLIITCLLQAGFCDSGILRKLLKQVCDASLVMEEFAFDACINDVSNQQNTCLLRLSVSNKP